MGVAVGTGVGVNVGGVVAVGSGVGTRVGAGVIVGGRIVAVGAGWILVATTVGAVVGGGTSSEHATAASVRINIMPRAIFIRGYLAPWIPAQGRNDG